MSVKEKVGKVGKAVKKVPFIRPPQGIGTQTIEGFLLHFPVGVLSGLLIWSGDMVGIVFGVFIGVIFYGYEAIEDWMERDRSYRDVFGYLVGLSVMGILYLGYRVWEIAPWQWL